MKFSTITALANCLALVAAMPIASPTWTAETGFTKDLPVESQPVAAPATTWNAVPSSPAATPSPAPAPVPAAAPAVAQAAAPAAAAPVVAEAAAPAPATTTASGDATGQMDAHSLPEVNNASPSVTAAGGLRWFTYSPDNGKPSSGASNYKCLKGPSSNFPSYAEWMPFDDMFNVNKASMQVNEGQDLITDIHQSILAISAASKVDARLILAVIMQESSGNVHVPCTNNGVQNCGLMQAYIGSVSFNAADPAGSIKQMIKDGTQGTASGGGLVQAINDGSTGGNVYVSLRKYNSGSVDTSNLSNGLGSTPSYVSDVANRLLGWNGNSRGGCTFA